MTDKQFYILLGVGVVAVALVARQGGKAVSAAKEGLDVTSNRNWFYRAADNLVDILSDGQDDDDQYFIDLFDFSRWGGS